MMQRPDMGKQPGRDVAMFLHLFYIWCLLGYHISVSQESESIVSYIHSFRKEAFICVWVFFFFLNTQLIPVAHVKIGSTWVCEDYGCPFWQTISFNSIVCSKSG